WSVSRRACQGQLPPRIGPFARCSVPATPWLGHGRRRILAQKKKCRGRGAMLAGPRHPPSTPCARFCATLCVITALCGATGARAESIEEFYRGKTLSIILFTTPGSIYDTYARLLGRYLPRHLAGQPSVVVKNMSGAGGLQAARHLNEAAPRDGTTIGGLSRALIFEPPPGPDVPPGDY